MNKKKTIIITIVIILAVVLLASGPVAFWIIKSTNPVSNKPYYDVEEEQLLTDEYTDLMKLYVNIDEEMLMNDAQAAFKEFAPNAKLETYSMLGNGNIKQSDDEYISFEMLNGSYLNFVYHYKDKYITEVSNGVFVFYNGAISTEYETKDGAIVNLLMMK